MPPRTPRRSFLQALGPGLLFAGAAVGVSHLVQSTTAGALYGVSLMGIVLLANVLKYPAFSFGPRYAAATGTSLLEGYRRQGRWALALYGLLTLGTMFTIQAAVTIVTAGLAGVILELPAGQGPPVLAAAIVTGVCALICGVGEFRWLDRIMKVVVAFLTVATFAATALALPEVDWSGPWLPSADLDVKQLLWLAALIGWMPSAIDISVWHSLWTLARRRDTGHAPSVRESLLDFNIGYVGTALLAFCFVFLGAAVMHGRGVPIAQGAVGFAAQIIALYTKTLGAWSAPLIASAAFMVMFSTTLTVIDGFPRALAGLWARSRAPEQQGDAEPFHRRPYWISLTVLAIVSIMIIAFVGKQGFKSLIDFATSLSFVTAPVLAVLNHRAILGAEVPDTGRPGRGLVAYSLVGIVFLTIMALGWIWLGWIEPLLG